MNDILFEMKFRIKNFKISIITHHLVPSQLILFKSLIEFH